MNTKNQKKFGFTLVELMIVAPTVVLVIGIFVAAIIAMTGDVLSSRSSNVLTYNIQNALDRIKQDVSSSSAFLASNNISISSPQGYNNDSSIFHNAGTDGNMLILSTYATTTNPANSNFDYVYSNHPNACGDSQVDRNQPITLNIIYFVKNGTLWRRVVAPSNYATSGCSKPWQQPSCAPGVTNAICKAEDTRLVDGSSNLNINYYSDSTSTTPDPTASDSSASDSDRAVALEKTNTVSVTINATSHTSGRTVSQTGTIRATGPNTSTAYSCPDGYINVPGSATYGTSDFCVMKYEAKNVVGVATSQATGLPWVNISQTSATTTAAAACTGCHLITEAEWMTIAQNVLGVASNWSDGAVGSGYIYSGHNDDNPDKALEASSDDTNGYYQTSNSSIDTTSSCTNDTFLTTNCMVGKSQRRTLMLTNGEVIWDFSGNVWELTQGDINSGQQPGNATDTGYTWRQWTDSSINWNALPVNSRPVSISINGDTVWNTDTGIGGLLSYYSETTEHAFARGGAYLEGQLAGVLALHLDPAVSSTTGNAARSSGLLGFRVAR